MKTLFARKVGMTNIFTTEGKRIPVTALLPLTMIKVKEKLVAVDGTKRVKKSIAGQLSKDLKIEPKFLKEVEQILSLDELESGKTVEVSATSKGKGFAGTIKRHGFHRGPTSHGSDNVRQPGSIGSAFPQRVLKGKKMAGHLGNKRTTVKNLEVIAIDKEKNAILLQGSVPGPKKGIVEIKLR